MIIYAITVTFFLGCLTTPVVLAWIAYRNEQIDEAKRRHPSSQDPMPFNVLDYSQPN